MYAIRSYYDFDGRFDGTPPAVDRLDARQEIDAGGQLVFQHGERQRIGGRFVGAVGEDEQG